MSSIDMTTAGAVTVTPPALGLRSAPSTDQVVLMAPYAAPWKGTGLPVASTATPIRLRGLVAAAGTTGTGTGACLDASVRPSAQIVDRPEFAGTGVSVEHTSSTPGDLPPEDPLS